MAPAPKKIRANVPINSAVSFCPRLYIEEPPGRGTSRVRCDREGFYLEHKRKRQLYRRRFSEVFPPVVSVRRYRETAATGALTGVSQLWRSGLVPLVRAKNSSWSLRVMGPATPLPTWILSTERMGVISTAVPQKKTSSTI